MTVSEFIEWLKTQDQRAVVEVVCHANGRGYEDQGGNAYVEEFTPEASDFQPAIGRFPQSLLLGKHGSR